MKNSFFINHRPISWLLIIGIIFVGLFSVSTIPREVQPEVNIPIASVATMLPGATPLDTESLVTEPIENAIASVADIKNLNSSSGLGLSTVILEFEADADIDKRVQEVKDRIDLVELPEDATDPIVSKAEANNISVINFSVIGDLPLDQLTNIAEDVQTELEKVPNVSEVKLVGGANEIVEVKISPEKIETYGLSINLIAQKIKSENNNLPIGTITTDKLNYSVTIDSRLTTLDDLKNLPLLSTPENGTVLLGDIAEIQKSFRSKQVISKLSLDGESSRDAISLQVFKKKDSNVIKVVDDAKAVTQELKKNQVIPQNIEIAVSNDYSEFIRTDLGILVNSGIQTTILIIIILFLALGFKEGLLSGLSIPLTLMAAFTILDLVGLTMNSLTLFALVIALGLMVDTAIVIMEGIHENLRKGLTTQEAAVKSIETYKWPLIAGTMTTIFAFSPMLLVSGIVGEFLKSLPITISAALISSLFISLAIIPAVAVSFLKDKNQGNKSSILEPIFHKIGDKFEKLINKILPRKAFRVATILIAIALLVASFMLPVSGMLRVEMFPKTDFRFFIINIETPKGLSLDETIKSVAKVEQELYERKEIQNFLTIIGSAQGQVQTDIVSFSSASESNKANITINLVDKEDREKASYEIAEDIRKEFQTKFTDFKVQVQEMTEGPPSDSPVVVRVTGKDLKDLQKVASDIEAKIAKIPGTQNIQQSLKPGLDEFQFTLDRDRLAYYGLTAPEVTFEIRSIVQGIKATEAKINSQDDLDIIVKYDITEKFTTPQLTIRDIQNFTVTNRQGQKIPLQELANFELRQGLSTISHENQKRIIKVSSDVDKGANPALITQQVAKDLESYDLPEGVQIAYGGDAEAVNESFRDLFRSMIIGIILIAFTLVLIFNSLRQPFIILLTLPLALIGVFPGLLLVGLQLSFPAFLGVVALGGVVVNDAIVLIDRINNNRKSGMEFVASIAEAANARLQPIIMTSLTTIVGILPLALTNEFWAGLGFSLIFGLACATGLTLIIIPVIYYAFESKRA